MKAVAHRRHCRPTSGKKAFTTSAFGIGGTGQVSQLPFYDHYARRLHPKLLVLVFVPNDFRNNSPILMALWNGLDPDRQRWTTGVRGADGGFELRPPDPEYGRFRLFDGFRTTPPFHRSLTRMARRSWFVAWAAEALFEWLERHQEVCGVRTPRAG